MSNKYYNISDIYSGINANHTLSPISTIKYIDIVYHIHVYMVKSLTTTVMVIIKYVYVKSFLSILQTPCPHKFPSDD